MNKTVKRAFMFFLCISFFPLEGLAQSSWKSPEYKAESYRKVMVLAKTTDELAKRQIEDFTVRLLMEKGITAIPAYSNITDADISTEEKLIAKADELQVDALLAYTVTGRNTQIKNSPRLDAHLGIPVRVGIFRGFLGTNVPIAGGTKSVAVVNVTASFFTTVHLRTCNGARALVES